MGDDKGENTLGTKAELGAAYDTVQVSAKQLADSILALSKLGPPSNAIQRAIGLAIERLEECMHRVNDGMHFLMQSSVEGRDEAALRAIPGGKA